ncbi:MAG: cysteine synthase A [Desulfuromonas sp.]|nr:MAG: cysteine synthase A [Desulfuromonas sp.]
MPITQSDQSLGQIGNTSLVRITLPDQAECATVWGKLETTNPGGSIKDRIALAMIEEAEKEGFLNPGGLVVEPTSGNTGIGLSLVCSTRGYRLTLTMPETMSQERRRLLSAFGAELVLTPGNLGMRGAIEAAEELVKQRRGFMPQQFSNPVNPAIHEQTTGPEILAAVDGQVDAFVAGVGTGGTITGVGRALRKQNPDTLVVAVEPETSPVLSGGDPGPHGIQGIGAGFIPDILDTEIYNEVMTISDKEAITTTRLLARTQGLLVGISSGANLCAAHRVARQIGPGKQVVTVLCDTGERYLSTGIYD